MSLRNDLAGVLARDPRYPIHAYAFVLESLEYTKKSLKKRVQTRTKARGKAFTAARHVSGRELCEGVRQLALEHYGLMAMAVLNLWGIRSTSDLGDIVFNLIASGGPEKTPSDARAGFDHIPRAPLERTPSDVRADFTPFFKFDPASRRDYVLALDEVA